jgi:uncharacterized membrane protein YedE/YeeE
MFNMLDIQMAIIGGLLIGGSASLLLLTSGQLAGISGILKGILSAKPGDTAWRVAFIGGLLTGGVILLFTHPSVFAVPEETRTMGAIITGGLFVGFGVSMAKGCTSGHGICGLSRLSGRSLFATCAFMATGFATATAIQILAGGIL